MATTSVPRTIFDTESLIINATYKAAGSPVDLTGGEITMRVRQNGPDGTLVSTLSSNVVADPSQRITILDQGVAENVGKFEINMPPADVQAELGEADNLCYAVVFTGSGGAARQLFSGEITVKKGV